MTDDNSANNTFTTDDAPNEQASTTNPFGRDLPPHITLGKSRSGVTQPTTQDDSPTGGDE